MSDEGMLIDIRAKAERNDRPFKRSHRFWMKKELKESA
jgi:hypothetical protein